MSSYNNIEKIKYTSDDCVVNLQEYIIFENERAEEKYVVFKFTNNVNQQLLGMEFEVSQYDADNNLVEKSVVIYNKFLAKPVQSFVPNAKLKVNYACKSLSIRLIQAAFDRFIWKEGQFLDNSYKFEHYARDEDTEEAKKNPPAPPVKVKEQKPAPAPKKRKGKLPFRAKNSMRKNIARFPAIFNTIVLLLAVGAIFFAVFNFNKTSQAFTVDNFDVRITDKTLKTVAVFGYSGEEKNVTVPETIQDYTVVRISENAFKNSEIQSIKFNSTKLYIDAHAFSGCEKLKTVTSSAEITVHGYAFENCTALRTVSLPNATLLKNSLKGCTGLTELAYGSLGTETLEEVFGGNLPKNLTVVDGDDNDDGKKPDDGDGGDGGSGEEQFEYDPNGTYTYGELQGKDVPGYIQYASCEAVSGKIITVNTKSKELTIPKDIIAISDKVYDDLGVFETLILEGGIKITPEVANKFTEVTSLYVAVRKSVSDSLIGFPKLSTLSVPCELNDTTLTAQYSSIEFCNLNKLVLRPTDACKTVPYNIFGNINATEIEVGYGFMDCNAYIVSHNTNVEKLILPDGMNYQGGTIGVDCPNLTTVDVYLENFDVSYCEFNLSSGFTKNVIIRCKTLDSSGYFNGLNRLDSVEIHAESSNVTLSEFMGSLNNASEITVDIKDISDDFYN